MQRKVSDMKWYASWFDSPFYQWLYDHRNDEEAAQFITSLMEHLQASTGSNVLDLACGNGRHSRQLAAMGMQVTGVDLSPSSIALAVENSDRKGSFYIHDMRQPLPYGPFDYILNLFTSFGYFEEDEEHQHTLQHVAQALVPGGVFALDFLSVPYVLAHLVEAETIEKKGLLFHIRRKVEDGYIIKEIRFTWRGDDYFFRERVRAYTKEDLETMLVNAGLRPLECFGDYGLHPYTGATSPRLILTAKR